MAARPAESSAVGIRHIGGDGEDVHTLVAEPRRVGPEALLVDVDHEHPHALADEGFDDGQADAAGGTGHDRGAALQSFHWKLMVCQRQGIAGSWNVA